MIKKDQKSTATAPSDETVNAIVEMRTASQNSEKARLERAIQEYRNSIQRNTEEIEVLHGYIAEYESEAKHMEDEIAAMPPVPVFSRELAEMEAQALMALPFVQSVRRQKINDEEYIVITTRENSLFTKLNKKFSRNIRWYNVKPYRIPLPAYDIRVALAPYNQYSNNRNALGLTLAYQSDMESFSQLARERYSHQPHAHWGTPMTENAGHYNGICLGEYESEVTRAFKSNLVEGLTALAIYLQTSGTGSAYISRRYWWALWLGKKEYNELMIPSEKDSPVIAADEETDEEVEDEEDEHPRCTECDGCIECGDCECVEGA